MAMPSPGDDGHAVASKETMAVPSPVPGKETMAMPSPGGLGGIGATVGSGPNPRPRRFVLRKARLLPGGVGQKLDDRPGDTFTDGACTGAGAGSGIPHS
jgi:hypothetical protein